MNAVLESAAQYYFLDWVATALSFLAMYLLGSKNRLGFVGFLGANVCWIVFGFMADSIAITIGNVVFAVTNLRGFVKWKPVAAPAPHP